LTSYTRKPSDIFKVVIEAVQSSRSNVEHQSVLANNMEEIMVKVRHNYISFDMKLMILILSSQLAELDHFLQTHAQAGDGWAP
jgi:hypothetical protein